MRSMADDSLSSFVRGGYRAMRATFRSAIPHAATMSCRLIWTMRINHFGLFGIFKAAARLSIALIPAVEVVHFECPPA